MKNDELDPWLKNTFNDLQNIPPRSPQAEARGRVNFLKQAAVYRQADSQKANQSHKRWSNTIFPLFQRRERLPVLNTLVAIVIAVVIFFGGTGATVYAAQDSLPYQALYPLKTWSEDAILSVTGSTQTRLNYVLDFSDRRVAEMAGLLAAGKPIPEAVETRFQNELELALELAAGMDDSQAIQQLEQIRQRAETQMRTMTVLLSEAPESAQPLLLRIHACLQQQIQLATLGETDLQGFRMQLRQRFQNGGGSREKTPGTGNGPQSPGSMMSTGTPVPSGNGNGPDLDMNQPTLGMNQPTGSPGQNGPGAQTPDRAPQSGGGSGQGPKNP
jgi:hypothetical protein